MREDSHIAQQLHCSRLASTHPAWPWTAIGRLLYVRQLDTKTEDLHSRYDANEILPAHMVQSGLHNRQCQDPVICAIRPFDKDRYVLQGIQGGMKHDYSVVLMKSAIADRLVLVLDIPCRTQ